MVWYNNGKCAFLSPEYLGTGGGTAVPEGPMDLLADTIKIMLMLNAYSINIDTNQDVADIIVSEISNSSVTGYVARGDASPLASKTVTLVTGSDQAEFDALDLVYSSIGNGTNATFNQIVVIRERTTAPVDADTLLIAHTTVSATTTNGGDITLVFNAAGLLQIT